jgi:hypothetical protein
MGSVDTPIVPTASIGTKHPLPSEPPTVRLDTAQSLTYNYPTVYILQDLLSPYINRSRSCIQVRLLLRQLCMGLLLLQIKYVLIWHPQLLQPLQMIVRARL